MPLDTSIPLQVGQGIQVPAINPMALYQAAQERQYNALRGQLIQQEMQKNALAMQQNAEDRRAAAAQRAQEQALLAQRRGILGNFGVTDAAVGAGPGTKYTNNNLNANPFDYTANQLIKSGDIGTAEALRKAQNEALTGRKTSAETSGILTENQKKEFELHKTKVGEFKDNILSASTPQEVFALIDSNAPSLEAMGITADRAKQNFMDQVNKVGFDRALLLSAKGAKDTAEHIDKMLTGKAGRADVTQDAAGNQIIIDKATGTAMPVTMTAPAAGAPAAGAPAAGAPAAGTPAAAEPVKAKLSAEAEKAAVKSKEAVKGIDEATSILKDLIKPDSLLDQSTGSYLGSWVDAAARGTGFGATKGSQATAQLRVFADPILKMIPRFEGPQSDKDTQTYKEAAGMLADDTVPAADRRAAAKALLALFERRKGQFEQASGTTAPSAAVNAAPTSFEGWSIKVK